MIKKVIRIFAVESTSLYIISNITSGLYFENGAQSLLYTGGALTVTVFLVKPIINLLILPINLVTFNFFRFASHAITLFLVDLALSEFAVRSFNFNGFSSNLIDLPPVFFEAGVFSYLAFSFVLSFLTSAIYWIVDKK